MTKMEQTDTEMESMNNQDNIYYQKQKKEINYIVS